MNVKPAENGAVITGLCRLSYAHIWEPSENLSGQLKYSCAVLIPKADEKTVNKVKAAIEWAKEQGKASKWGGKIPGNLKLPLRDGDGERPDDPNYEGMYFVNANSNEPPGIVDTGGDEIDDPKKVYSGCWCRFDLSFYPYDMQSKGVACGLNNIQLIKKGESLSGRKDAKDVFDDGEDLSEYFDDDESFID
jgi:hypothetical protein